MKILFDRTFFGWTVDVIRWDFGVWTRPFIGRDIVSVDLGRYMIRFVRKV